MGLFLKYINYLILNESHRKKGLLTSNYFKQNLICNDRRLLLPFFLISRKHSSLSIYWLATWIGRFLAICCTMLISHRKSAVLPKRYLNIHFHSLGQWYVNQLQSKVVCCLVKCCVSAHRDQPRKITDCICQPRQHLSLTMNRRGKSKKIQLADICDKQVTNRPTACFN